MEIEEKEKEINNNDIIKLEEEIGIKLPLQLRQHYLKHNGGQPVPNTFYTDEGQVFGVHEFYSITYGKLTISKMHKIFSGRIPEDLLCFGCDEGGGQICISVGAKDYGAIFFFDHEFESQSDLALTFLSPSFQEFMNELVDEDEE